MLFAIVTRSCAAHQNVFVALPPVRGGDSRLASVGLAWVVLGSFWGPSWALAAPFQGLPSGVSGAVQADASSEDTAVFLQEEAELSETISAIQRAISVLEREMSKSGGAALVQVGKAGGRG